MVDDLEQAAADEALVLDDRDVGLDAGRVAVHEERDRAGRREHRGLAVAEAVLLAELRSRSSHDSRAACISSYGTSALSMRSTARAVLAHDAEERRLVLGVAGERAGRVGRDLRRLAVRLAAHQRGDRRGVRAAGLAVVRQRARHEQRAEVRVAEAERAERVAVLGDLLGRVRSSCRR